MKKNLWFVACTLLGLVGCQTTSTSQTSLSSSTSSPSSESSSSSVALKRQPYSNPCAIERQDGTKYFVTTADPDIVYGDDGYFYLYTTNCEVENGKGEIWFDKGPIFRSKNLSSWMWVGSVFDGHPNATDWGTPGAGVWAPSVTKIGSTYNYYYSLSTWGDENPGVGVATAKTPYGPWTHHGKVIDSISTGVRNSIDPQCVIDNDQVYLIWGSFFGIAATLLTDDGLEPFYGEYVKDHIEWVIPDNSNGGPMDINKNYEGSYIIKRDGYYYYFGSQGTCCSGRTSTYRVKTGKSTSLFGPYLSSDGLDLVSGGFGDLVIGPNEDVAGVGHNAVIQDFAGDYYLLYHGFDLHAENKDERVLFLDKLLWDENQMPYVDQKVASYQTQQEGPLTVQ